jgi:hypothetical protein
VSPVSAEPRPIHIDIGFAAHRGSDSTSFGFSPFVGYAHEVHKLSSRSRVYLAAGGYANLGWVRQEDRRAVDGEVNIKRYGLGAEARLGLLYGKNWPKVYTYLGGGPVRYWAPTISENLAESGSALGYRLSLGAAAPGSWGAYADTFLDGPCDGGGCVLPLVLAYILPNKLEISYEVVHGPESPTHRIGGGFGYSF